MESGGRESSSERLYKVLRKGGDGFERGKESWKET